MIIAVNTRLNKKTQPEGYEDYLLTLLYQLTENHPRHQFLFITDRPLNRSTPNAKNVTVVVSGPKTTGNLGLHFWFNYKIPAILRKYKANVFLSLEGICSLRTRLPQLLLIYDPAFIQYKAYLKKHTAAFLNKAKTIATTSDYAQKSIAASYKIEPGRISIIPPCIDKRFRPLDWEEQEAVREKYTEGRSYFLCCSGENLVTLLRAFTLFKKRQKSNMQLVITGDTGESFKKDLASYKLRNDVKLAEDLEKDELAKLTAAAYAVIHPVLSDNVALPALPAFQCDVPVLMSGADGLRGIYGEAALYFDPHQFEDIAQQLMLIYKDEDKAREMVNAGNAFLERYQPAQSAGKLMNLLEQAVQIH